MKYNGTVTIDGQSCSPTLMDGETYYFSKLDHYEVGDFVVFKTTEVQKLILANDGRKDSDILVKQVYGVAKNGYYVKSTVPNGVSSNLIGIIQYKNIYGKVQT